jgi:hypothetical protein
VGGKEKGGGETKRKQAFVRNATATRRILRGARRETRGEVRGEPLSAAIARLAFLLCCE